MTHMVPKQYSTYDSDKGLSSAWLNSMLMNVSGADKGSPGLAPGINSNGKNSPALNPNNGNGRNSNGRNSPGFDASEEDSANSPSNGTTAPKNTDWRTMEGVGAENDMWEVNSPSKTALKHSMCIARACSYSTASAESPAKHKNWSNSEVMLTEGEKQVMREEEKASSIQFIAGLADGTTTKKDAKPSKTDDDVANDKVHVVLEGDVYIRKFIRCGEAVFRVMWIDEEEVDEDEEDVEPPLNKPQSGLSLAYNEREVGVTVMELRNSKMYELLYRGTEEEPGGSEANTRTSTPCIDSARAPQTPSTPPISKVSLATESRYFGKNPSKTWSSLSPPHSSFYDRFHVYKTSTAINGVVSGRNVPAVITRKQAKQDLTALKVYDDFDHKLGRVKRDKALKKTETTADLTYLGGEYFVSDQPYGIGTEVDTLQPLDVEYRTHPTLKCVQKMEAAETCGEEQGEHGARPQSPSFHYLEACNKKNVAPWDLLTKFEDPSEPTLNLKGMNIGANFSECLSQGLMRLEFLEKVDLSDNRLGGEDVKALLDGLVGKNVRCLDLSKNRIGEKGARRLVEFMNTESTVNKSTHKELLESLSVGLCELGEKGATAVLASFNDTAASNALQEIDISKNSLTKTATPLLLAFIEKHAAKLVSINLAWNELTGDGAKPLFAYFASPAPKSVLSYVNLEWNGIEGDFIREVTSKPNFDIIAGILECLDSAACTILHLNLDNNKFSEEEIKKLGLALNRGEETDAMLGRRMNEEVDVEVLEDKEDIRKDGVRVKDEEGKDLVLCSQVRVVKKLSRQEHRELLAKRVAQFKLPAEEAGDGDGKDEKKKEKKSK